MRRQAVGVLMMVILQGFCSVRNISGHFPSEFVWGVASSIDKVFESLAPDLGVEDSFDLVLFCAINDYRWGWRLYTAEYSIDVIKSEEKNVKH